MITFLFHLFYLSFLHEVSLFAETMPKQILNLRLCILLNFVADFCWMCCGDWRTHGSEYYECSRYKSNPNIVNESAGIQAREALKKYLFYFERVIATLNCDQFLFSITGQSRKKCLRGLVTSLASFFSRTSPYALALAPRE